MPNFFSDPKPKNIETTRMQGQKIRLDRGNGKPKREPKEHVRHIPFYISFVQTKSLFPLQFFIPRDSDLPARAARSREVRYAEDEFLKDLDNLTDLEDGSEDSEDDEDAPLASRRSKRKRRRGKKGRKSKRQRR